MFVSNGLLAQSVVKSVVLITVGPALFETRADQISLFICNTFSF